MDPNTTFLDFTLPTASFDGVLNTLETATQSLLDTASLPTDPSLLTATPTLADMVPNSANVSGITAGLAYNISSVRIGLGAKTASTIDPMLTGMMVLGNQTVLAHGFVSVPVTPHEVAVSSAAMISLLIFSMIFNMLLGGTLALTPSLRTPPNALLMNICVTSLVLCVSMAMQLSSVLDPLRPLPGPVCDAVLFLDSLCGIEYWFSFISIAVYRIKTLHDTQFSVRYKKTLAAVCISAGWLVALLFSTIITARDAKDTDRLLSCPFSKVLRIRPGPTQKNSTLFTVCVLLVTLCLSGFLVIVYAYINVFKKAKPLKYSRTKINQVNPLEPANGTRQAPVKHSPVASVHEMVVLENRLPHNDLPFYRTQHVIAWAGSDPAERAAAAADNNVNFSAIVCKDRRSTHGSLPSVSDDMETSDISGTMTSYKYRMSRPVKQQVLQQVENKLENPNATHRDAALALARTYSRRKKDRLGRTPTDQMAARNSIAMVVIYIIFTVPIIVLTFQDLVGVEERLDNVLTQRTCKLIFYVNGTAYPVWYLLFSPTVRNCIKSVIESALVYLSARKQ
ncbi:Hypp5454 [Branchiostoma lanceolatum]|uniref:Hypp5454 protein n=1 Tax=Branchiostoma lanceolatum TaxID=7740 RepID=A0A8J9VHG7_BRALA|nr:Hypp5454 [Branchiostoma lanceolatum]